ncbi:hypothetical protein [Bradyrhizobium sp. SZCCHNRI3052]|uniref:hypothetical protein n=1 Tax=Bradyrhizobium sp. SZCCHNRI3052 TaxID=3057295 RepID=UPI002916A717|nr:hypothetical protein [Bradyrhizobium sp. SZCCHNRI3052]
MRSYSIRRLRRAVENLKETARQTNRQFASTDRDFQDSWLGWLDGYRGPGYYNRSDWDRDARFVYQHLNSGPAIVWLNEAAGVDRELIERALRAIRAGADHPQMLAKIARQILPWEQVAWLLFRLRSYRISELLRAVRTLPATMPQSDKLSKGSYETHQDHWIAWLKGYDGPGDYGRADWEVDARAVYQRLNNGHMIVWLNEAAGEDPQLIRQTISKLRQAGPAKQTRAAVARSFLPWDRAAMLLFGS